MMTDTRHDALGNIARAHNGTDPMKLAHGVAELGPVLIGNNPPASLLGVIISLSSKVVALHEMRIVEPETLDQLLASRPEYSDQLEDAIRILKLMTPLLEETVRGKLDG